MKAPSKMKKKYVTSMLTITSKLNNITQHFELACHHTQASLPPLSRPKSKVTGFTLPCLGARSKLKSEMVRERLDREQIENRKKKDKKRKKILHAFALQKVHHI
jgi:hypothetical protein